jgi:enoyl-CoA hydratase/carnithine racemase
MRPGRAINHASLAQDAIPARPARRGGHRHLEPLGSSAQLARRLATLPPHAVREARRLLNSHIERAAPVLSECARAESECFETDEHRAALDRLSVRLAARLPRES